MQILRGALYYAWLNLKSQYVISGQSYLEFFVTAHKCMDVGMIRIKWSMTPKGDKLVNSRLPFKKLDYFYPKSLINT